LVRSKEIASVLGPRALNQKRRAERKRNSKPNSEKRAGFGGGKKKKSRCW